MRRWHGRAVERDKRPGDRLEALRIRTNREQKAASVHAEQLAGVIGTTAREQLAWLLKFANADVEKASEEGRLREFLVPLAFLIPSATSGQWVPAPYPQITEVVDTRGVDRAPWQRQG